MQAYKIDTIVKNGNELVLDKLPFQVGDQVEVIILKISPALPRLADARFPLRGKVSRYDEPFEPVALPD